jgi:hypothetical protein
MDPLEETLPQVVIDLVVLLDVAATLVVVEAVAQSSSCSHK